MSSLTRRDVGLLIVCLVLAAAAGILDASPAGTVLPFAVAALALAALATLVGRCVDALGDALGAGATGVVQSALGNLPELFVCLFALRAGLNDVVRAAIVGSVLSNVLLVLGLAFVVGGLKHGTQRFDAERARSTGLLLLLAVSAMLLPALTSSLHSPAAKHELAFSRVVAVVLLLVFALSLPAALKRGGPVDAEHDADGVVRAWPLWLSIGLLAASGVAAAFVSDWFVHALTPATTALGLSQTFAGLVVVAIAGNAVENTAGLVLAWKGQTDLAISVVKNSVAQIAAFLFPVLVLISFALSTSLTFALAPVYIGALALTGLALWQVTGDGEAAEFEGWALVAIYVILGTLTLYE